MPKINESPKARKIFRCQNCEADYHAANIAKRNDKATLKKEKCDHCGHMGYGYLNNVIKPK